ncbi:MAG: glycosyltransferase family 4 protein [Sphingopyxis sp.]|uniref:glycosyltransferase family 4 protein n=1 Tax=Sphingopyxis sp. TaxID=1908224 RepID=UPI001A476187|nr:glycosyltransferase family 4 protein [Sphingopyxis sp.]MBL9071708.1 glycosyltransferase family 4 protein [Sphingopyxis sp.]
MRIALISQYFFPEQFSNNAIAREMLRRGHEVHAISCVPNYPAGQFFPGYSNTEQREQNWEGVQISRAFTVARGKTAFSLIANYLTYPVAASWTMFRRLRHGADVSFVSMPSPLFQALAGIALRWRTGTPCVYWVQDIWPESATYTLGLRNRFIVGMLNRLCGWIYRRADIIMIQSAAFHDMIARFGVSSDRIRILPNTAPETYRPLTPAQAPEFSSKIPQDGFRIMFAGNIGESQDFDTIIAAAALLRERDDLHWIIVGSGRDEERAKRLALENGLADRFHFLGRFPEETMPSFFAHADAMLVSLKSIPIFALTVPYKIQCYMACGKPIIASLDGEGGRIVNESGSGFAVPATQPQALATAIVDMIDAGPAARSAYAANARRYFDDHYTAEKIYGDLERALADAARGRTHG